MSDLNLDLARLESLHQDLASIVAEFKNADEFSDAVADATGDDHLADKVRDFAHAWNEKRKNMTESVEGLVKAVGAITDNFTKVDAGLAKALQEADSEQSPAGGGGGGAW